MHIAITGAAGFLGQRLVKQLLERSELRQQPSGSAAARSGERCGDISGAGYYPTWRAG